MAETGATGTRLAPVPFESLPGWQDDDLSQAWLAFRQSAIAIADSPPKTRSLGFDGDALSRIARAALDETEPLNSASARRFFETHFTPIEVIPEAGQGFYTGFYEPEALASRTPDSTFKVPLYCAPPELVEVTEADDISALEPGTRFARRTETGLEPYFDRGEIERGALSGRGLELAYLADPVDVYFIHVQGAARLRLPDGSLLRVTYSAKSGHSYTPLGRVLLDQGALQKGGVSMQSIRAWLAAHPDEALPAMWHNRSFIFFREAEVADPSLGPIAAAKVPLTAGRSLAVDRTLHTFHMPIWIDTALPGTPASVIQRLMVAQDTGSAILGPARGDIFFGSGDQAGALAGVMAGRGRFVVLAPRPGS
jgi:membrane-bound lytic murein transglycosylase A